MFNASLSPANSLFKNSYRVLFSEFTKSLKFVVSAGTLLRIAVPFARNTESSSYSFLPKYLAASRIAPFACSRPSVKMPTTADSPYLLRTYSIVFSRTPNAKSESISGILILSGLRKRSKIRLYLNGSIPVIPSRYVTNEPAPEPRPIPIPMPISYPCSCTYFLAPSIVNGTSFSLSTGILPIILAYSRKSFTIK